MLLITAGVTSWLVYWSQDIPPLPAPGRYKLVYIMCPPQQGSHPHPLLIITNDNSDLQWSLWPQFGMKMLCAVLAITYLVLVAKVDGPNDLKDMFSGCFLVQPAGVLLQLLCNHQNIESRSQCAESYRVWCGPHTRTPGTTSSSSWTPEQKNLQYKLELDSTFSQSWIHTIMYSRILKLNWQSRKESLDVQVLKV